MERERIGRHDIAMYTEVAGDEKRKGKEKGRRSRSETVCALPGSLRNKADTCFGINWSAFEHSLRPANTDQRSNLGINFIMSPTGNLAKN